MKKFETLKKMLADLAVCKSGLVSTTGRDHYDIPHFILDACGGFPASLEMTYTT
jgi:hypothetical protein